MQEVSDFSEESPNRFQEEVGSLAAHWGSRDDVPLEIRQRLYPAVFEAFANNDYSNVGIRELSRISGLSSATIYKYFESKEILLTTIYAEVFPFMADEMEKSISTEASTRENFRSMFRRLFEIYDQNNSMPIVFFITVPVKLWMESGGWRTKEVWPIISRLIEGGKLEGSIDPKIKIGTAFGIFFMHVQREVQLWYHSGRTWRLTDRVDYFFPYFWRAIYCPAFKESDLMNEQNEP